MQKTEKHCKNQCFCYHKTTKISPKTGHLRNRKKRCCKPKNWGQKVEKHRVFSLFACRFWTGAFTNRCLPYCFFTVVFWRRASRPIKNRRFWPKNGTHPLLRVPSGRSRPSTFGAGGFREMNQHKTEVDWSTATSIVPSWQDFSDF